MRGKYYAIRMRNEDTLQHHGILGMKWGVRRTKEQLAKSRPRVKMELQYFAAKRAGTRKTPRLSAREYAHVMSELRSHITKEEKLQPIVYKHIDSYLYGFENHFDDTYRVVFKKKIPQSQTGILRRINDVE